MTESIVNTFSKELDNKYQSYLKNNKVSTEGKMEIKRFIETIRKDKE